VLDNVGMPICVVKCMRRCVMRTNIVIDEELLEEAMKLSGLSYDEKGV
jgi:Arc/MetJ family transcription regulator